MLGLCGRVCVCVSMCAFILIAFWTSRQRKSIFSTMRSQQMCVSVCENGREWIPRYLWMGMDQKPTRKSKRVIIPNLPYIDKLISVENKHHIPNDSANDIPCEYLSGRVSYSAI